jgi:hypothetical protein
MNTKLKKTLLEAFKILKEAEMAQQQAPPSQQMPASPQSQNSAPLPQQQPQPEQQSPTVDNTPPASVTIDNLIEQLNIIRAGKSFGEPAIYKAVSDMYDGIEEQKKIAVQEVIKKIADTLTQASANLGNDLEAEQNQAPVQPNPQVAPPTQQPNPQQPII